MTADFKFIKQKTVHKWAAWSLVQADFADPVGEKFVRTFVDSPGAVGVVALVGEIGARRVLLVRQYRPPFDAKTLEIPAGMRDQDGEDPEVTARRELEEEAGFVAGKMLKLGSHESAPGISNSVVHLFVAIACRAWMGSWLLLLVSAESEGYSSVGGSAAEWVFVDPTWRDR